MLVRKIKPFNRVIEVDPDKSITHRALILGAAACGETKIYSPSTCLDCRSTLNAIRVCGVSVGNSQRIVSVPNSAPINSSFISISGGIKEGNYRIDAENSGTTARLLCGLFSSRQGLRVHLTGDQSLSLRPMKRIIDPLSQMGAKIQSTNGRLPLTIEGGLLGGINYHLPIPSAQLKSALLLAGLGALGQTNLSGELDSRNHTELMLLAMGADISIEKENIALTPSGLRGVELSIGGDFSSSVYFLALALLTRGSSIAIKNLNLNPTRTAALELLSSMGANIHLSDESMAIEKRGTVSAQFSTLSPFRIGRTQAKLLIDELPILATMACFIEGDSVIEGAEELRLKESDRIAAIADGLTRMGAKIDIFPDGMIIRGRGRLKGECKVSAHGDHRIEMSLAIAAALSECGAEVEGGYAQISFPSFYRLLGSFE